MIKKKPAVQQDCGLLSDRSDRPGADGAAGNRQTPVQARVTGGLFYMVLSGSILIYPIFQQRKGLPLPWRREPCRVLQALQEDLVDLVVGQLPGAVRQEIHAVRHLPQQFRSDLRPALQLG